MLFLYYFCGIVLTLLLNAANGDKALKDVELVSSKPPADKKPNTPLSSEDKKKCLQDIQNWCDKLKDQKDDTNVTSFSQLANSFYDGKTSTNMFCARNLTHSECQRNGKLWFTCSSDGILTYEGKNIESPDEEVDDKICDAKRIVLKFDTSFHHAFPFNATDLFGGFSPFEGFDDMVQEWQNMRKMMTAFQNHFFSSKSSFFNTKFLFDSPPFVDILPDVVKDHDNATATIDEEKETGEKEINP